MLYACFHDSILLLPLQLAPLSKSDIWNVHLPNLIRLPLSGSQTRANAASCKGWSRGLLASSHIKPHASHAGKQPDGGYLLERIQSDA